MSVVNNKIKFVYFDVGGVALVDFSGNNKWQEMAADFGVTNADFDTFRNTFRKAETVLCNGKSHYKNIMQNLQGTLRLSFDDNYDMLSDFVSRFERNESIHRVVSFADQKFSVGLLTNMYPKMLNKIMETDLLPDVKWKVVIDSSEVGYCKPNSEIFDIAEQKAGVKPEEIMFVDNLKENVDAARERGWNTFYYDSSDLEGSSAALYDVLM